MQKNNNDYILNIFNLKEIVSVTVMIAIIGLLVFSSALNPLWAKSNMHVDKTSTTSSNSTDKKGNSPTTATTTSITTSSTTSPSSNSEQSDYKKFQKCLSTTADKQGFATKADIQKCFKPIYTPTSTTSSSTGTNSSTLAIFNKGFAPNSNPSLHA